MCSIELIAQLTHTTPSIPQHTSTAIAHCTPRLRPAKPLSSLNLKCTRKPVIYRRTAAERQSGRRRIFGGLAQRCDGGGDGGSAAAGLCFFGVHSFLTVDDRRKYSKSERSIALIMPLPPPRRSFRLRLFRQNTTAQHCEPSRLLMITQSTLRYTLCGSSQLLMTPTTFIAAALRVR